MSVASSLKSRPRTRKIHLALDTLIICFPNKLISWSCTFVQKIFRFNDLYTLHLYHSYPSFGSLEEDSIFLINK
ncbi:hypothetical protein BpHYR1_037853 [Brachionus plicatilis]|uniref:Uncharacterized protein n=1 Tax=Brachionus plicatilis TaxID=10195 RepID=A0A3M7RQW1_BRAPC|nr:hypothetical protein BpHYR1_037853 [Brachionus plicatilis]